MKLASLAYEIARDSIEIPSGINKDSFIRGDYDTDRDFKSQISFAFNYINLAFARLISGKKTGIKIAKKVTSDTGYLEFHDGEILAIVSDMGRGYKRAHFRPFMDGVALEPSFASKVVYVEYRPFIPKFDMDSIRKQVLDDDNQLTYEERVVDLEDYGISDEMCAYVKEYAKGGLMEYLSPELSSRHTQMAESYFASLKTQYSNFPQREIENRLNVGGVL